MAKEPLPVGAITVPDDRFGQARGDKHDDGLLDLSRSVEEFGILEPILLDEDYTLIAGMRRLSAALLAGREELDPDEYRLKADLTDIDKRRIELEENIMRKNLTWAEEAKATAKIHQMRKEEDPSWTVAKTAEVVGKSVGSVQSSVELSKEMEKDPELENKDTLTGALREIRRNKEMERRKSKAQYRKTTGKGPQAEVIQGDALDLIGELRDGCINAIITNPPFGVDLAYDQGLREPRSPYNDDRDSVTDLVRAMAPEMYRVLKPDSWLVCFFATRKICLNPHTAELVDSVRTIIEQGVLEAHHPPEAIDEMEQMCDRALGLRGWLLDAGFDWVQPTPSIWVKPNKTQGHVGNPDKPFVPAYESFLFAAKGQPQITGETLMNTTFTYDTPSPSERVHQLQMSEGLCTRLAELTVLGGEIILDPFCGSGAVGLGALNREADFLGFELDKEYADRARTVLREHMAP